MNLLEMGTRVIKILASINVTYLNYIYKEVRSEMYVDVNPS